jgi:hypothetical protein
MSWSVGRELQTRFLPNTSRMLTAPELLTCLTVVLLLRVSIRDWRQRRLRGGLPLPPGPKGLPIIGNMLDFGVSAPLTDWAKKYGTSQLSDV